MAGHDADALDLGLTEGDWDRWDGRDVAGMTDYVAPASLDRALLNVPGVVPRTIDERRAAVESAWALLGDKQYPYRADPWDPYGGQWIRDPLWFDADSGSCLDFTLVWAAMCLYVRVAPLIVVARGPDVAGRSGSRAAPPGAGHALALLDLGRDLTGAGPRGMPLAGRVPFDDDWRAELDGTGRDAVADLIRRGRVLAVDPVRAARSRGPTGHDRTLAAATRAGETEITGERWRSVQVVDVVSRWRTGHRPRRPLPRQERPAVTRSVPPLPAGYRARPALQDELDRQRERARHGGAAVALQGDQGMGKSALAQRAAALAPAGWFLNASDRTALLRSLARAERTERSQEDDDGDSVDDIRAEATGALARLRQPGPWTVVVDNSNIDPAEVADLLPVPGDDQLLVLTTTNRAWIAWVDQQPSRVARPSVITAAADSGSGSGGDRDPGHGSGDRRWEHIPVGPMEDDEVAALGCPEPLIELAAGRPLFATAFAHHRQAGPEVPRGDEVPPGVDPAAQVLWALARPALDDRTAAAARAAAWLQPDAVPPGVVSDLAGGSARDDAIDPLIQQGILTRSGTTVRIHRLVAGALRAGTGDDEAVAIVGSRAWVEDGIVRADDETVDDAWARVDAVDRTEGSGIIEPLPLARALWSIMTLLEPLNRVRWAGPVAERLQARQEPAVTAAGDRGADLLADALHNRAREVNQKENATRDELLAARELVARSRELRGDDLAGTAKADALDALLQRALTAHLPPSERVPALRDVLRILERSRDDRVTALGDMASDTARAVFNLGGAWLRLAQADDAARVEDHLEAAQAAYESARVTRRALYRTDTHIHLAASHHGLGLVAYYRAVLCRRPTDEQVTLLRQATTHLRDGLDIRQALDAATDGPDVCKSLVALAKVADARAALGRTTQLATEENRQGREPDPGDRRARTTRATIGNWQERAAELRATDLLDAVSIGAPPSPEP